MTDSSWVNSIVSQGYSIIFNKRPPVRLPPLHDPYTSLEEKEEINKEITSLLQKRAIEECTGMGFYSRLFTIPKKTGGLRPVLNLRPLNQYLTAPRFKMETLTHICQMLRPKDWLTSIDLSDAFLHVAVQPASRRYLRFRWQGRTYQFRTLPFGLSLSPYVFTKIIRPILQWARKQGIRISAYLDDILVAATSEEESRQHTHMVRQQLERLGFLIKTEKSMLTPSQQIDHLGFHIDTLKMALSVPGSKIRDLRREATKLLQAAAIPLRRLASFIGRAMSMTVAIFPARLKTRHLIQVQNEALARNNSWTESVTLDNQSREDLDWWRTSLSTWNGHGFLPQKSEIDVFTDASQEAWGIVYEDQEISKPWSPEEYPHHINYKELKVIWYLIQRPDMRGRTIQVICDNTTAIAQINKFGGTRSPQLLELATSIWDFCIKTGTRLMTTYVPSQFNPADSPSRRMTAQLEWSINSSFFQHLDSVWGPHSVDLFASAGNAKVPRYISWLHEDTAWKQDAFSCSWKNLGRMYVCPPWSLLNRVMEKIRIDKAQATVITPDWPSMIWYPTVKTMSISNPIPVPRAMVQPAPGNSPQPLERNPMWSLLAWNVDGSKL